MGHIVRNNSNELPVGCALVLLLCLSGLLHGVDSQNVSSEEMAGLQALWEAWKINTPDTATNLENWGNYSFPCGWRGVECDIRNTTTQLNASVITRLYLRDQKIVGVLPPEISLLSNLEYLYLDNNRALLGPIPKEIAQLTKLLTLELARNMFSGEFPFSSITNISRLSWLSIWDNQFEGTIREDAFQNLIQLETLYLDMNNFTGQAPDVFSLYSLTSLWLSGNKFTGQAPDVSSLYNLTSLGLSGNNFTGQVPDVSSLYNLTYLDLSGNNFTGQPPNVSQLTKLRVLDLSRINFGGLPPELSPDARLEYLDYSGNRFDGAFSTLPRNKGSLISFIISGNLFRGEIPQDDFQNSSRLNTVDLSNNKFTGPLPNFANLSWLTLDLSNNKFTGPLPNFANQTSLTYLNLSYNLFTGLSNSLKPFFRTLPENLYLLDLSGLDIAGPVPEWNSIMAPSSLSELYLDKCNFTSSLNISAFLANNMSRSLDVLSLTDNKITNVLTSDDLIRAGKTKISLQGNPYCNYRWSSQDEYRWCSIYCGLPCIYLPKSNNRLKVIVTASTISSAVILMLEILGFAFILRRNQKYIRNLQKKIKEADINAKRFEYNELRVATKNFAPEMKFGAGAYGTVFKGILVNNTVVAVKQLFLETDNGRDDFLNEVLLISNLQHRNLVTLKGYCLHGKQTLLVYEYVDNCDLDKLLSSPHNSTDGTSDDYQVLNWQARMNVCQGVAQGLYYLHASSQSRIIHRDIKASNILLDKSLQPKIADFGLARPIEDARSFIVTQQCAGTLGYLAPEYMYHGQLSDKADVFSFGVLLLEIVSGKRNRDPTMPEDEVYLPTRAWKLNRENRLLDMKDPTLLVSEDEAEEVQRVLETAVLCVQNAPEKRPSMFLVAPMLAGKANVDVAPIDELYDNWPVGEREILAESDCENPLFTSSTSAPSSSGPIPNRNATIELSMLHTGR